MTAELLCLGPWLGDESIGRRALVRVECAEPRVALSPVRAGADQLARLAAWCDTVAASHRGDGEGVVKRTSVATVRRAALCVPVLALVTVFVTLPVALQGQRDLVNQRFVASVASVIDGDTVDLSVSGRTIRTRLHGMDAPESGEPYSTVARTFLRVMVFSRTVQVVGTDIDRYGRLVARIAVDGKDASEAMVSAGLACTFHQYAKEPALDLAMSRARASKLGFWAQPGQLPRCAARELATGSAVAPAPVTGFVGNVSSLVYHAPTCRNAGCKNCTRKFATREDAERAGFRAAGDCLRR